MKLLEKITNFFSGISLELDQETESQLMDYLLEGVDGLNQINISDLDKNEIIKWKLREFKKFLKYGDGFEKKIITLELYKEWEKKNQRNFDDPVIKNMWGLIEEFNISFKIVHDLLDGIKSDIKENVKPN